MEPKTLAAKMAECNERTDYAIQVMQAFRDGRSIEAKSAGWERCLTPQWDWAHDDYRVAKPPTFEESVRAHLKSMLQDSLQKPLCSCARNRIKELYRKLFNEEP